MQGNHLVREARRRADLTQAALAARVGTTQSALARLEGGVGHPTMLHISDLVAACGFELQVRLVPADDHDWGLVARNAAMAPADRLASALAAIALAEAFRDAGAAARHGA